MFEVGDKVWFKEDIEGYGVVAKVQRERNWLGGFSTSYAVKSDSEPNGYPFHRMASFDYELNCMVVWVDEDHIWAA